MRLHRSDTCVPAALPGTAATHVTQGLTRNGRAGHSGRRPMTDDSVVGICGGTRAPCLQISHRTRSAARGTWRNQLIHLMTAVINHTDLRSAEFESRLGTGLRLLLHSCMRGCVFLYMCVCECVCPWVFVGGFFGEIDSEPLTGFMNIYDGHLHGDHGTWCRSEGESSSLAALSLTT